MSKYGLLVVQGQKLCPKCRFRASKPQEKTCENDSDDVDDCTSLEEEHDLELTEESLSSTLSELEISPIKFHSIAPPSKPTIGKRKLEKVEAAAT